MERRFIEEFFPINEVSKESSAEKNIRRGHISALHIWWARRPLSSSRTTIFASLIDHSSNPKINSKKNIMLKELSKWENSNNYNIIDSARSEILSFCNNVVPKVLDPFSGGGAIPLECMRMGCETYASDYNSVAVLIEKCTLEYPKKYSSVQKSNKLNSSDERNKLVRDVEKWADFVYEKTKADIHDCYLSDDEHGVPIGYVWARIIKCPNTSCGVEIPLIKQYWLSKKELKKVTLFPQILNKQVSFKIFGTGYEPIPKKFQPSKGTISRSIITCLNCNSTIPAKETVEFFQQDQISERIIAVIYSIPGKQGKFYRISNSHDVSKYNHSNEILEKRLKRLHKSWGISPIPDENLPPQGTLGFRIQRYNMKKWGDLYNSRQKLVLITLIENIKMAYKKMLEEQYDKDYSIVLVTYLSLILSRCTDFNNKTSTWLNHVENAGHTFSKQAIAMVWDYFELNLFSESSQGTWISMKRQSLRALEFLTSMNYPEKISVKQEDATAMPYKNDFFDAIFTDPPYYDNVPYANLSDFFYVWLKRAIGEFYPDLFSTPLTPKTHEIVAQDKEHVKKSGKLFFEENLQKSFLEINRVLKPNGIAIIVYAHKSTEGWETLIKSLLISGLTVTASWPLDTEMKGRQRATDSASLASSIYMICRKWKKEPVGFYRDVKKELEKYLNKKLEQLWNEGISGSDFFISAIGSSIEVFGKYEKVVNDKDEQISVLKLLNDTRAIVTDYAINKAIKGEFSDEISQMTRFYILWRWAYGEAKVPFDNALKMAQSIGIDIEREWNKGFIVKEKEFIRVLGPDERNEKEMEESHDLINVLHKTLLLWKKGDKKTIDKFLEENGYKNSDMFKRVAQAISESLHLESTEKKWLDGFLTGFKADNSQSEVQSKLVLEGEE